MRASCTDKKIFELIENNQLLGQIVYKHLFSLKAEILLPNGELYEIKPLGVFGTTISIRKDDIEVASMKMNWKGQIVIILQNGEEYLCRGNGVFFHKFSIENSENEKLLLLAPTFNWKKFDYNYEILFEKRPDDILLVLLGIYTANYQIASITGTVAFMA